MAEIGRLSYVTEVDTFYLVTTFFAAAQPQYNCSNCLKKYSETYRKTRKFCTSPSETPITDYHGVIKYFQCPGSYFNHGYRLVIESYRRFQDGVLPYSGGLMEQPAKILEAFETIRLLDLEHGQDTAKNLRPKRGNNGRQPGKNRVNR